MRTKVFAVRNAKEILRDPLSYIFCLGFPAAMLIIMTIVNKSIPAGGPDVFKIEKLAPGIAVFGFTFIMLFTAILLSKDRCGAFLNRLYASPMKPSEFIIGYIIPVLVIAIVQCFITYILAEIISLIGGNSISIGEMLISIILLIPAIILFISLGLIFGGIFNDKAAPGISSILITVASILGGIWMDIEQVGGTLETIARALPFFPAVHAARQAIEGTGEGIGTDILLTSIYTVIALLIAVFVFKKNMSIDKK